MIDTTKNFAVATLSTGYNATATSIVLTAGNGAKFPDSLNGYNVSWWNSTDYSSPDEDPNVEIVRVIGKSTDTLTIVRGQEGTSATVKNITLKEYKIALTLTSKTIQDIDELASLKPLGAYAFLNSSGAYADTPVMPSNFHVKGNFTVFKRFSGNTAAFNSGYVDVQNDAGDRIWIFSQGYTFRIRVDVAGVREFDFSEATSVNFPGSPGKVDCFVEVDMDLKQVRLSYDGYTNSYSVPELGDVKDSVFTYNRADLSAYRDGVKSWYMLTGLYNHGSIDSIFGSANENALPQRRSKNVSVGKQLVTTQPTEMYIFGSYRDFVDGKINITATQINTWEYMRNDWVLNDTLARYGSAALTMTFSMDVVSGSMDFRASGGAPTHYLFRAVEKDTGVVIEARNVQSSSADLETLPVGRWAITMQFAQSSDYSTVIYMIAANNNEVDTEITVYQDFELYTAAVVLAALPQMADYEQIYCPFSKALLSGAWSLSPTY